MIISVASGKGGTGKTTVATSLALAQKRDIQFIDCDVEEPNAHIFLRPEITRVEKIHLPVPQVNPELCDLCGQCQEACAFNAIAVTSKEVLLFPELCHSCGACQLLCPRQAIVEVPREIGLLEEGILRPNAGHEIAFVHGRLNPKEIATPYLIRQVKARMDTNRPVIMDAPPGTTCPVVQTIKDSDYCLLVTEPTPFGFHDLKLIIALLEKIRIPHGVVINRCDMGDHAVESFCAEKNIPVLMRIPFSLDIARMYARGIPLIEADRKFRQAFQDVFEEIEQAVPGRDPA